MARVTPPLDVPKPAASHGPSRFSGAADLGAKGELMTLQDWFKQRLGDGYDLRAGSKILAERKAA